MRSAAALLIQHQAPLHWRPRNAPHLAALKLLDALAPNLLRALDLERGTDDLLREVSAAIEESCEVIRKSHALPVAPVELDDAEARRLLLVGDAVWRLLLALRQLKACGLPRRREARALTEARALWHERQLKACADLSPLLSPEAR